MPHVAMQAGLAEGPGALLALKKGQAPAPVACVGPGVAARGNGGAAPETARP